MLDRPATAEVKRLADMLALVLDDQPGNASAALQKVREKARRDGFTQSTVSLSLNAASSSSNRLLSAPPLYASTGRSCMVKWWNASRNIFSQGVSVIAPLAISSTQLSQPQ